MPKLTLCPIVWAFTWYKIKGYLVARKNCKSDFKDQSIYFKKTAYQLCKFERTMNKMTNTISHSVNQWYDYDSVCLSRKR